MAVITYDNIEFLAKIYGWVKIPAEGMLSFRRSGSRINIWHDKWGTLTVGTALEHPTLGKTQLFRKRVGSELLEEIFDNPRTHTKAGYITKKTTNARRWR